MTAPLRIAIFDYRIVATNPIGGCHLHSLRGLARAHSFTVFAVDFENPDPTRIEWVRIPVPTRPLAALFILYHLLAPVYYVLYRLKRRVTFDVVQMVESNLTFGTVAYTQFCHRAYLKQHWTRSKPSGVRGALRWLDHRLHAAFEPFVYRRVRDIVVPSKGFARELLQTYPFAAKKIRVIPNPVDIDYWRQPQDFDRTAARSNLGIAPSDFVLVFAALGQFERKGLPLVLQALVKLTASNVKLFIVGGEADLVRSYAGQVARMGLTETVTFTGARRDLRPYFWAADAFILPSYYETFSLVSFEAAAAGLPLIVSRLHGVEDLMSTQDCGYLIDRNADAVAKAISELSALPLAVRSQIGKNASRGASSYSTTAFVDAWKAFYSSLTQERMVPQATLGYPEKSEVRCD